VTTEILVGGTTVYLSEWLKKGVVSIKLIHRIVVTKKNHLNTESKPTMDAASVEIKTLSATR